MNFAEEMNILAIQTKLIKQQEMYQRAQSFYENFKPSIKHFASLGCYQATYTMPVSEICKKDRADVFIALKNLFINEGFQIHAFNTCNFSCVVSWANATTKYPEKNY